ncbi:hypothetical protein pb186bvf_014758 [Paramecium bursaria]
MPCVAMSRIIDLAFNSKYLKEYESIFPYEVNIINHRQNRKDRFQITIILFTTILFPILALFLILLQKQQVESIVLSLLQKKNRKLNK